jgi:hypothetical protein
LTVTVAASSASARVATATTLAPSPNSPSSVRCAPGVTVAAHLAKIDSGAPIAISLRERSGHSSSTEDIRRSWSNGRAATLRCPAGAVPAAMIAASSGLVLIPSDWLASSPSPRISSEGAPLGSSAAWRLMLPSVRVPVLSVTSTSTSPRSSMQTSRFTSTFRLAMRRDPVARLVLTTAGSNCGVMPTAMARENRIESRSGRARMRLVIRMKLVSTRAIVSSSPEKRRSPIWNSVSGCRCPSPTAIRPNSACPPVAANRTKLENRMHQR